MDRIIYAIPYTSIIEQNTGVFRKTFGELEASRVATRRQSHHHARVD